MEGCVSLAVIVVSLPVFAGLEGHELTAPNKMSGLHLLNRLFSGPTKPMWTKKLLVI